MVFPRTPDCSKYTCMIVVDSSRFDIAHNYHYQYIISMMKTCCRGEIYRENVCCLCSRLLPRIPTVVATDPGFRFHPSQSITIFLAKISPNPSITPFTKGNNKLTAREEKKAVNRVCLESDESKMAEVSDTGTG